MAQMKPFGTRKEIRPVIQPCRRNGLSGPFRTYRGLHGETIRVPERSIVRAPKLHSEPHPFPFACIADTLGPSRDRFAHAARSGVLLEETLAREDVRRMMAR